MSVVIHYAGLLWWALGFWCGVFATIVMIRKFRREIQQEDG